MEDKNVLGAWIGIGFLIFVSYVLYHNFVTVPDQKLKIEASQKLYELAKQEGDGILLNSCIDNAIASYHKNWKSSCDIVFQSCLASFSFSFCQKQYDISDDSWNCLLPNDTVKRWDSMLQTDKQNCYSQFKK